MYSNDFREKVVLALSTGRSIRKVASDFCISTNTVRRWKKSIYPSNNDLRGHARKIDLQVLRKDVEIYPNARQHERAKRLNCSRSAIGHSLKLLNKIDSL